MTGHVRGALSGNDVTGRERKYSMKKSLIFAGMMTVLAVMPARAHPPSDIAIKADGTKVDVVISHGTKDAAKHYIARITVRHNGKDAIVQDAITQTGEAEQDVSYVIPGLARGDRLEIEADCSLYGTLTRDFTIE